MNSENGFSVRSMQMKQQTARIGIVFLVLTVAISWTMAREYHVSPAGDDGSDGTVQQPLKTISAAAQLAQPGDVVTIHAGVYRERVTPPRGGSSDQKRITYQAAAGEKVVIKGSSSDDRIRLSSSRLEASRAGSTESSVAFCSPVFSCQPLACDVPV